MTEHTAVYRIFGEDDTVLYVGMTRNPEIRLRSHARSQPWWPRVQHVSFEWCATRQEARILELETIRREDPPYNVEGTPRETGARTGRPKSDDPRDHQMLVRVTAQEKQTLEAAAAADEKPAATWLRDAGLAKARRQLRRPQRVSAEGDE